ncbi:hypothetical protein [Streptomyces zagrosensis]|uniref:DUF8017 domain-containing protein n=1 Tax=Streptomyces zagrosensis TaxID=1042984 RepID=A0A7W9V0X1_9ACTN|nr:hypothetical protein [Streptomyces zagrosensis]MBB5937184.1 hypothetical protein [Streptomyces zagrosensis]
MWPGQQPPGGEQNPQDQNPYQQPGHQQPGPGQPNPYQTPAPGQPNPYQQPGPPPPPPGAQTGPPGGPPSGAPQHGAPQQGPPQPNPYQQQPGYPQHNQAPQTWNTPATPGAPQPPQGGGDKRKKTIAIVTATAVVAAAIVVGVVVFSGDDKDDKKNTAQESTNPSASASSGQPSTQKPSAPDNPRGGDSENPRAADPAAKPVIPGWKTVISAKRHVAFDVPATEDWKVESSSLSIGFESDKGKPLVIMSSPAKYKQDACSVKVEGSTEPDTSDLGGVGTKGALGAKSEGSAAEVEAENWVFAGYDQKQTGERKVTKAKPFQSEHGLKGYAASATVTGVKKDNKCTTNGKAFTVAYTDVNGDYALWVLHAATGTEGELPNETIEKIKSSLRPLKSGS